MEVRQQYVNNIRKNFAHVKASVELSGSLNLTDVHIHSENFFRDFFNELGYSFVNTNFENKNSGYIDLIDKENKRAIQVTAQNDSAKISGAIVGFYKKQEYKNYALQVLLIAKKAKDYITDFTHGGKYDFNHKRDVIDLERLLAEINNKETDVIKKVSDFLDKEILLPRPKTEVNEVETIMALLEYLSDDSNCKGSDVEYECDPEQKINVRFKNHAGLFKDEFAELYSTYCIQVSVAKERFGLDGVRAKKVSTYLSYKSNKFLRDCGEDPIKALDDMTDYLEGKLCNNGISADVCAIRYYLLDELIGCSLFSKKIE